MSRMPLVRHLRSFDNLQYLQALILFLTLGCTIVFITLGILGKTIEPHLFYALMIIALGGLAVLCCQKQRMINRLRGLGLRSEIIV